MTESLRISPADAKARVDAGEAIFLDVVTTPGWEQLTIAIPGAVRIPPEEIERRFGELPRDRAIIAYCT